MSRACAFCVGSLEGRRRDARFCSRACKTKASDRRRIADGREQTRNLARYEAEAERRKEQAARWQREHPEIMRVVRRRRKGQLHAEALMFTERDWRRLLVRYSGCCAYCGVAGEMQREHVVPLARGGRHSVGNILPACARCNGRKKTKFVTEWRLQALRRGEEVTPNLTPRGNRTDHHRTHVAA